LRAVNAALVLALAGPAAQTLTDEAIQIPPRKEAIRIMNLEQVPVRVECEFHVLSGANGVRAVMVNAEGLDSWKRGNRDAAGAGSFVRQGGFNRVVSVPDDYAVIVENAGAEMANVRLRVALDYSERGLPQAKYVSTARRVTVVLISTTVFLAIVGYSARRLWGLLR